MVVVFDMIVGCEVVVLLVNLQIFIVVIDELQVVVWWVGVLIIELIEILFSGIDWDQFCVVDWLDCWGWLFWVDYVDCGLFVCGYCVGDLLLIVFVCYC